MKIIESESYRKSNSRPWDDSTNPGAVHAPDGPTQQMLQPAGDSEKNIQKLWTKKKKREVEELPQKML